MQCERIDELLDVIRHKKEVISVLNGKLADLEMDKRIYADHIAVLAHAVGYDEETINKHHGSWTLCKLVVDKVEELCGKVK